MIFKSNYQLPAISFAHLNSDEYERMYENLREQEFQLKHYGHFSIFEMAQMTAEDRSWHVKRVFKEMKDKADAEKKQMNSSRR
jgi:hypothetical protein